MIENEMKELFKTAQQRATCARVVVLVLRTTPWWPSVVQRPTVGPKEMRRRLGTLRIGALQTFLHANKYRARVETPRMRRLSMSTFYDAQLRRPPAYSFSWRAGAVQVPDTSLKKCSTVLYTSWSPAPSARNRGQRNRAFRCRVMCMMQQQH